MSIDRADRSTVPLAATWPTDSSSDEADQEFAHGGLGLLRTIIEPRTGWQAIDLKQLWKYRELLYFLIWRDVLVRYKQTVLGAAWAVIQPVMTMVTFAIVFGRLGGMAQHVDQPYPVFIFAALLPWTFFSNAVSQSSQSLVANSHLISKVYFPRLLVPWACVGTGLVDFAISFGVLVLLMLGYKVSVSPGLMLLPVFVAGTVLAAVGVGTLLAAVVIAYRDLRHVITFALQLWMFASPVAYPLEVVPREWRLIYALNPMAGMISGFRSAIFGMPFHWDCILISWSATLVFLCAGMFYFRRVERRFADIV